MRAAWCGGPLVTHLRTLGPKSPTTVLYGAMNALLEVMLTYTHLLEDPHILIPMPYSYPVCHLTEPYFNRFLRLEFGTLCVCGIPLMYTNHMGPAMLHPELGTLYVWHSSMYSSHMDPTQPVADD